MKALFPRTLVAALPAAFLAAAASGGTVPHLDLDWQVVANSGFEIPEDTGRYYNSYNPPSVNAGALVVFRARSTGQPQGPVGGVYTRRMAEEGSAVSRIADRTVEVPEPNNTWYPEPGGQGEDRLSMFNEFPSFPRMAMTADMIATRGNHEPVWTYFTGTDPETGEDEETRVGTTGVYVNLAAGDPALSPLITGASLLGEVTDEGQMDYSYLFRVPGVEPAVRFEVFPGAPAITDEGVIVFKGNYSVPAPEASGDDGGATLGKTGVFYRKVVADHAGGLEPIHLIANSDTPVPNPGACAAGTTFGSTAPPSAVGEYAVFVGLDNEADPTCGGIYRARLTSPAEPLTTLVGLERWVPDKHGEPFSELGEGLAYDGRFLGFWGAWGDEVRTLRLYCPEEGNKDRRNFCNNSGDYVPDPETGEIRGDPNSVCDDASDPQYPTCYQEKTVPVNQGLFVYDTVNGKLRLVVATVPTGRFDPFDDFVYWKYSGAPPGAGHSEGHAEPPRFRSGAYIALSQRAGGTVHVAFQARLADLDTETNTYVDVVDGIYLAEMLGAWVPPPRAIVQTGMEATVLDPQAMWDDDENAATPDVPMPIASLAMERDGFRGDWFAITASMGHEESDWGGIYMAKVPSRLPLTVPPECYGCVRVPDEPAGY